MMKVQRVCLANMGVTWIVLNDDYVPVQPVLDYLKYLYNLDRSPNTIRGAAHRLKLFWEYLRNEHLCWREITVAQLAAFIPWLRRFDPTVISIAPMIAPRSNATIDLTLGAVYSFYSYHMRLGTLPDLPLYQLTRPSRGKYKPFLHGIVKAKPEATRVVFGQTGTASAKDADKRANPMPVGCLHAYQGPLSVGTSV